MIRDCFETRILRHSTGTGENELPVIVVVPIQIHIGPLPAQSRFAHLSRTHEESHLTIGS